MKSLRQEQVEKIHTRTPELLAPAGSLEAFFAAMESGADAVYCGLKTFSARAKAKNIGLEDLSKMVGYAHDRGRHVYVALNTLVKEKELGQLVDTLGALESMAVDAVILQDMGVYRLARQHFPGIPLHSSTQMTVHNVAGVKMLERLGFERAVLARELTLDEITHIRKNTQMDLEHFIHGALCFCFSGQCYFSSWLGGKSGNRGRCAQPCRRQYKHRGQEGYYFSPNDLSAIDLLPELSEAGIMSLKIEGRMKSAEYVANVVAAYRLALDAERGDRKEALREAKNLLKLSFGRLPTQGFLSGEKPSDIAIPSLRGSTGRFLGDLISVRGNEVTFKTKDKVHIGDRLRVQPQTDRAGQAFTVRQLKQGKRTVKMVTAGGTVTAVSPVPGSFKKGDAVFKVASGQAFSMSENACRKRLAQAPPHRWPLTLNIQVTEEKVVLSGTLLDFEWNREYPVQVEKATGKGLRPEMLEELFAGVANYPFTLADCHAEAVSGLMVSPKRLKEIRRDYYGDLAAEVKKQLRSRRDTHQRCARESFAVSAVPRPARRRITVAVSALRDIRILQNSLVDFVQVPLTAGMEQSVRLQKEWMGKLIWDIPFVVFDKEWDGLRKTIHILHKRGFRRFRLNNLGHFPLFEGLEGLRLQTGYRLFSLNSQAMETWKEEQIERCCLYLEDDAENIGRLLQVDGGMPCDLMAHMAVPLMVSRITVKGVRGDGHLHSDRGEGYRVIHRGGLMTLIADTDFSLVGRLDEIQAMGCDSFTIDLSHTGPFSPAGKKILEAVRTNREISGTLPFNFVMGME